MIIDIVSSDAVSHLELHLINGQVIRVRQCEVNDPYDKNILHVQKPVDYFVDLNHAVSFKINF